MLVAGHSAPEIDLGSGPSKTQRKRDMHALQTLGEALVALPPQRLAHIPLDERLRAEIDQAQRISSHEGRRRQLQFIGKLMRDVDADLIRAALDRINDGHRAATAVFHQAESWRNRLIEDPDALALWCSEHGEDPAPLANAVSAARAELAAGRGGRRHRELFRHVRRRLLAAAGAADLDPDDFGHDWLDSHAAAHHPESDARDTSRRVGPVDPVGVDQGLDDGPGGDQPDNEADEAPTITPTRRPPGRRPQ